MLRTHEVSSISEEKKTSLSIQSQVKELRRKTWPEMPSTSRKLRIVDLFCGCGGLTLGAVQAALSLSRKPEVALALDTSRPALDVYQSNFSSISRNVVLKDVAEYVAGSAFSKLNTTGDALVSSIGKIDVLLAGPPCQGNSDLNNSSRRMDPRNDLYLVPTLFAKNLTPSLIIVENVPAVVHGHSNVVSRSIAKLNKFGYACSEFHADLTALGLPQTRRRHLLVASLKHSQEELDALLSTIPIARKNVPLGYFISDLADSPSIGESLFSSPGRPSLTNRNRIDYMFDNDLFDLPNTLRPPCHRDKKHSYISMYGRLKNDEPAQTITSGFGSMGQGRFVHPNRRRTITP
ncbi:DNA cytosine methyltransferase, partial [Polaromonas sp. P5_E6]